MTDPRHILRAAALLATLAIPAAAAPGTLDRCYPDWSEAAGIVQREALALARDVQAEAHARRIGDVVRMTLCEERGKFVYRLVVRESRGSILSLTVDARKPF